MQQVGHNIMPEYDFVFIKLNQVTGILLHIMSIDNQDEMKRRKKTHKRR